MAFYYNELGLLTEFQVNSWDIEPDSLARFHAFLPQLGTDNGLIAFVNKYKYQLRKEAIDLTFDRLHDWYGDKRDRYIAERHFEKLKKEWYHIFLNLKCYLMYCRRNAPRGYKKMMLKTYLYEKQYKSDWDKVENFK